MALGTIFKEIDGLKDASIDDSNHFEFLARTNPDTRAILISKGQGTVPMHSPDACTIFVDIIPLTTKSDDDIKRLLRILKSRLPTVTKDCLIPLDCDQETYERQCRIQGGPFNEERYVFMYCGSFLCVMG